MNKVTRPSRIVASLKIIQAELSPDVSSALEAYITDLEAQQMLSQANSAENLVWDAANPPNWSQERAVEREQHRQARNLQKLNAFR